MRVTRSERIRAEQLSAAINQLVRNPDAELEQGAPQDAGLLATARQLARLPALLGPVAPALEQRVMRQAWLGTGQARQRPRFKLGWAVAGLAATLLVVMLLTPMGQTAVASFMAVFSLGRTEVHITPAYTSSPPTVTEPARSAAVQQILTLDQAREQVPFVIPQPATLPPGYRLARVLSYTYPDLPAWVPQPFSVELVYADDEEREFSLRVYPIVLGEAGSTLRMNLEASPIQDVQDVDVNGQPGVLLTLGTAKIGAALQEVVWEHSDLILALSTSDLGEADLLRVARSIR